MHVRNHCVYFKWLLDDIFDINAVNILFFSVISYACLKPCYNVFTFFEVWFYPFKAQLLKFLHFAIQA